jgi:hypothetical protein
VKENRPRRTAGRQQLDAAGYNGITPLAALLNELRLSAAALEAERASRGAKESKIATLRRELIDVATIALPYTSARLTASVGSIESKLASPGVEDPHEVRERLRQKIERLAAGLRLPNGAES